jgi:hypothetical protein
MIRSNDLPARLRAAASGIEQGNIADPHGRRVGLLREAATELERLRSSFVRLKEGRHILGTFEADRIIRQALGEEDMPDEFGNVKE